MKTQIYRPFVSTLPDNDDHPYRSHAWKPQDTEYDAWDLEVVGEIPEELAGVYLRNTENPLMEAIGRYHPFDGDGMLHSISFADGEARYRNRFVRTAGLLAEQDAGEALYAGLAEPPKRTIADHGWGARTMMKDSSSTDVVVHRGMALSSFYQCGDLYRLDPVTLEPDGVETWGGAFPFEGVSAHTKVDEATGEMLFFNYSTEAPFMKYGVVDAAGNLAHYIDVPLPGPRLPHDMAFTENYAILNDCPLFWDAEAMEAGYYVPKFHRDTPTRLAVVPRRGSTQDIVWFEADPTFVLHWINAYEDGDEIVLDGFYEEQPAPEAQPGDTLETMMFRYIDMHRMLPRAHRWRMNLRTGRCTEEHLSETTMEFAMINQRFAGRPYRYSYNAIPADGWFGFEGIIKHDVVSGAETAYRLPDGVFNSETVMAPRPGSTAEDDGWLITFTSDVINDESRCLIFDAESPADGPVASIGLPERISSGTHATWAPASALNERPAVGL